MSKAERTDLFFANLCVYMEKPNPIDKSVECFLWEEELLVNFKAKNLLVG